MNPEWQARPKLASFLVAFLRVVPYLLGVGTAWLVMDLLPDANALLRFGLAVAAAGLVAFVTVVAARRALPFTVLLRLNLLFPDAAPSRFKVALRAGSTRSLEDLREGAHTARNDVNAAESILALGAALAIHHRESRGHAERVRALSEVIGEAMGLDSRSLARLRWSAFLHDVGKLHVHPDVLDKPAALDEAEWEIMRNHPLEGHRLVEPLQEFLGEWGEVVLHHHERWDGFGYPNRVKGTAIPLGARIVAVADTVEVMTSVRRPYRSSVTLSQVRDELVLVSGEQFDPAVVRAYLDLPLPSIKQALGLAIRVAQFAMVLLGGRALSAKAPGSSHIAKDVESSTQPSAHPDAAPHPDASLPADSWVHDAADGGDAAPDASGGGEGADVAALPGQDA